MNLDLIKYLEDRSFEKTISLINNVDLSTELIMLNEGVEKLYDSRYIQYENINKYAIPDRNISSIILHTTSLTTCDQAVKTYKEYGVSAHFIIDQNGKIYILVPLELSAYHAGISYFGDLTKLKIPQYGIGMANSFNPISIGIELLTPDFVNVSKEQSICVSKLIQKLQLLYPGIKNILTHSTIAPTRKTDPGLFALTSLKENLRIPEKMTFFPQCADEFIHKEFLSALNSSTKFTKNHIYNIAENLSNLGYLINSFDNMDALLQQTSSALADYLSHYALQEIANSVHFVNLAKNIQQNPIYQNIAKLSNLYNISNEKHFKGNARELYKIFSILNSEKIKQIMSQMKIDTQFQRIVNTVQNQFCVANYVINNLKMSKQDIHTT